MKADPLNAATQSTPRLAEDGRVNYLVSKSRVLPVLDNARSGWKESLDGGRDSVLVSELDREYVKSRSILRDGNTGLFRDPNTSSLQYLPNTHNNNNHHKKRFSELNSIASHEMTINALIKMNKSIDGVSLLLDGREVLHHIGSNNTRSRHALGLRSVYEVSGSVSGEPVYTLCRPEDRITYNSECLDYLFYSYNTGLVVKKLLTIPSLALVNNSLLSRSRGESPEILSITTNHLSLVASQQHSSLSLSRQSQDKVLALYHRVDSSNSNSREYLDNHYTTIDLQEMKRLLREELKKSHALDDKSKTEINEGTNNNNNHHNNNNNNNHHNNNNNNNQSINNNIPRCFWTGQWMSLPSINVHRQNHFLPNSRFASNHIALVADFVINEDLLSTKFT
jgi:hypothetical protein